MKRLIIILCTMLICMNFSSCIVYRDRPQQAQTHQKKEKQKKSKSSRKSTKPPKGHGN